MQPEDQDALECKLVLLIHAGRFADALALCPRFPKRVLEHAYCLFRTQEPQRALDLLRAGVGPTMATRELEAQLLYRTETYDDAVGLYREMLTANHVRALPSLPWPVGGASSLLVWPCTPSLRILCALFFSLSILFPFFPFFPSLSIYLSLSVF